MDLALYFSCTSVPILIAMGKYVLVYHTFTVTMSIVHAYLVFQFSFAITDMDWH